MEELDPDSVFLNEKEKRAALRKPNLPMTKIFENSDNEQFIRAFISARKPKLQTLNLKDKSI